MNRRTFFKGLAAVAAATFLPKAWTTARRLSEHCPEPGQFCEIWFVHPPEWHDGDLEVVDHSWGRWIGETTWPVYNKGTDEVVDTVPADIQGWFDLDENGDPTGKGVAVSLPSRTYWRPA